MQMNKLPTLNAGNHKTVRNWTEYAPLCLQLKKWRRGFIAGSVWVRYPTRKCSLHSGNILSRIQLAVFNYSSFTAPCSCINNKPNICITNVASAWPNGYSRLQRVLFTNYYYYHQDAKENVETQEEESDGRLEKAI